MYPVIPIGPATIQTAIAALIVAIWLGTTIAERECGRRALNGDDAWSVVMLAAAVTVVAARLIYALQNFPAYESDWIEIFALTPGTLSLDAGLVCGLIAAYAYVQHRRVPLARFADAFAPGALVALAVLALGQFLSGDAYGAPTKVPWAVNLYGETRHPVQLYDAFAALLGFVLARRWARRRLTDGTLALFAAAWYSAARVLIDAFRGNAAVLPGGYRTTQVIALGVLIAALWLLGKSVTGNERPATESRPPSSVLRPPP
jgi:phosphatidylglycerol:prolipoprotein diacylglycerol transferase